MKNGRLTRRDARAARQRKMTMAAVVVAMGLLPQSYAREQTQPRDGATAAARKTAETFVEAHAKKDLAAAKACLSKTSLKKHKAILTQESMDESASMTGMLAVTKVSRVKNDMVVRLRLDPKRASTSVEKKLARLFAKSFFPLCLVKEGRAWKIDLDKSKELNEAEQSKGAG